MKLVLVAMLRVFLGTYVFSLALGQSLSTEELHPFLSGREAHLQYEHQPLSGVNPGKLFQTINEQKPGLHFGFFASVVGVMVRKLTSKAC